jgi:hypothetical protein
VEEADYFKAEDKYTLVVTKEGESLIKKSIKELAQELDPSQFWQVHRGTIVNVSKIDKVSRSLTGRGILKLKGRPELLTVSRNYLHLFKQMQEKWGYRRCLHFQFKRRLMIGIFKNGTPSSLRIISSSVVAVPLIFLFSASP